MEPQDTSWVTCQYKTLTKTQFASSNHHQHPKRIAHSSAGLHPIQTRNETHQKNLGQS